MIYSHQGQRGVQCLAQGHFGMWTGEAGDQTTKRSPPPVVLVLLTFIREGVQQSELRGLISSD